jgi:hypothetical protein
MPLCYPDFALRQEHRRSPPGAAIIRALKRLLAVVIGLAGLACSAGVVYLIVCFASVLPYMDDDYCSTRGPGATVEGTGTTSDLSLVPPRMRCIYDTPKRGRVVIEHRPF